MSDSLWNLRDVRLEGPMRPRLNDVSLRIQAGVTAVVGASGAGKTSLLNVMVGFESIAAGTATFTPPADSRLPLFWVPQDDALWPHLSVQQHLRVVSPQRNASSESCRQLLDAFDLSDQRDVLPDRLSQGERSRLSLARACATDAAVIVMDEPLATVDEIRAREYWSALRQFRGESTALVFASHGVESVVREADQVVCMADGQVRHAGATQPLYHRPDTRELAEFLGPVNWFAPSDAAEWLANAPTDTVCCRPERIAVELSSDSVLRIAGVSTGTAMESLVVVNQKTQVKRTMLHRMTHSSFKVGDGVVFRLLPALIVCLLALGCDGTSEDDPLLNVTNVRHWPMPPAGVSIPAPRAVQIGHEGEVFVLDNAGRVLVFSSDAELLRQWEMPRHDVGKPEGLCVMQDGRIAVADTHYHRIVFFDQDGAVVSTQGAHGEGFGEFIYPVAIAQDDQGNYYVCEYGGNDRVQKFSVSGEFVREFGGFGTGPGEFQRPSGIVWHSQRVYVADAINNRVQVFSDQGQFVETLGDSESSWRPEYPYDLAKSVTGDLYLIEYGGGRVSWMDRQGTLLGRWGRIGSAQGQLATPWGLAVDARQRIYIADTGNRRIVKLELSD